jgi:hypothetical protein
LWSDFLWAWWGVVFAGVFEKIECLDVVNLWCECGVLRGGCGVLDVTFWASKKVPGFGDLFLASWLRGGF